MLIQKKRILRLALIAFAAFGQLNGCVTEATSEVEKRRAAEQDQKEATHRLGLVGTGPAYLIQAPGRAGASIRPFIAEVRLWKEGEELTAAYAYDLEITGESVYTVVAKKLALARLRPPAPTGVVQPAAFVGDLFRGYERTTVDSFMHAVTFKLRRVIAPVGLGPEHASCPWTIFGNQQELFALESEPLLVEAPQLMRVRVRSQLANAQEVEQVKSGICVRLARIEAGKLQPKAIYDVASGLPGKLAYLKVEVLEQMPFGLPRAAATH